MLTYTPKPRQNVPSTHEYPWLLLLLVFIWLWPGVFSHDLWKPGEPNMMQAIDEAANGSMWLPTVFGQAYFDVSPLYVQTAAWFKRVLTPWATDAYSAARFASVLFASLGLLGSGMAGYRFWGRHHGRSVVLILIGSAGLLPVAHFLNAQSATFAGAGLLMWGYAIAQRQVVFAALLAALGVMFLSQSLGFLVAALALCAGCLQWLSPLWRTRRYAIFLLTQAAMALPLLSIYPLALYLTQPAAFVTYVHHYWWGGFGGLGHFNAALNAPYYATQILWFAFPALPLAAWTAYRSRLTQSQAGVFALVWLGVFGLMLAFEPNRNQDLLVLMLPALALLGAAQLDNLRRGAVAFLNWFGAMTFGLAAMFLWLGFFAMNYGFPQKLAQRAAYFSPYYTPDIDAMPIITALLFTPMWIIALRRRNVRGRQAVTNWAAGMTLVWALLMTLFLPWIDAAKSYRPLITQMQAAAPQMLAEVRAGSACVYIAPQHRDARHAWQQYANLPYRSDDAGCRYVWAQYAPKTSRAPNDGAIVWQGHRPRNKNEQLILLDKDTN